MFLNGSEYKFYVGNTVAMMLSTSGKLGVGNVGGAPKELIHVGGGNILADSVKAWSKGFIITTNDSN
jgi:hypothetical protein